MIAISQPTYFSWPGYYSLIKLVDNFIFLDDVQLDSRSWQQRNKILVNKKSFYLTVPIKKKGLRDQLIKDSEVMDKNFYKNHLKIIKQNYLKSKYFEFYYQELEKLEPVISEQNKLSEINIIIIKKISELFNIKKTFLKSSELNVGGKRVDKLINLINILGENIYISNAGSKEYLSKEIKKFNLNKIQVKIFNFKSAPYDQLTSNFVPYLSVLDLLFNLGDAANKYLDDFYLIENIN